MGKSASEISQELEQSRSDATDKIEQIEQRMTDTADMVKQQVTDTTESVKQSLDWRHQVETRPFVMVGVAFMGGVVAGSMTGGNGGNGSYRSPYDGSSSQHMSNGSQSHGGLSGAVSHAVRASGAEAALTSAMAAMVAMAGKQIKDTLDSEYPGFSERYDVSRSTSGGLGERVKAASDESAYETTTRVA